MRPARLLRLNPHFALFLALGAILALAGGSPAGAEGGTETPAKPTGLSVDTAPDSLNVSLDWDDVSGAVHYWVRWRLAAPGNDLNEGVEVSSSDTDITVVDYGEWVVRVQACNDAGCGPPIALRFEVNPTTEPAPSPTPEPTPAPTPTPEPVTEVPAKPTGLSVDTDEDSLNVSVNWDDVDGESEYWVRWRSVDSGEKLNEGLRVQSSNTAITVADYGEWVVRVQACNSAGCGSPTTLRFEVSSSTEPTPAPTPTPTPAPTPTPTPEPVTEVPAKPTGLSLDTADDSLNVSVDWDDVDGESEYWVRWRSVDSGEKLNEGLRVQSSNTAITVADYGEWVVRVQACNSAGCGSPTTLQFEVSSATEPTPSPEPTPTPAPTPTPTPQPVSEVPAKPTGLSVDTADDSLNVSVDWDDVDGGSTLPGALAGGRPGQQSE